MKNELLQQRAKETREENNINDEGIISSIFENKNPETESKEKLWTIKENSEENTNKNILENKKILEKISYEANVYKKDGKLEEYENY